MNVKSLVKNKKGFTIIEVVLVLAIAGLIFLMVFIALPPMQRSQKDTQRKNDMGRLETAINNYQSNNNGRIPTAQNADSFRDAYLQEGFTDPDGTDYTLNFRQSGQIDNVTGAWPDDHTVFVVSNARCNTEAENSTVSGSGQRSYAILYRLEGGGVYCSNN